MFYVYKITNKVNGKVYIGKTDNIHERWIAHLKMARHPEWKGRYLIHKAIAKYGADNFIVDTIESFENEQEALDREMYWIAFHKSNVYEYGPQCGYNLTAGGDGIIGFKFSEEQKQIMSQSVMGENNPFYGKHHTDDDRHLMSEIKKEYLTTHPNNMSGKHHTDETKQLISSKLKGKYSGPNSFMYGKHHTDETKCEITRLKNEKFDFYSEINRGSKNPGAKLDDQDIPIILSMIVDGINDQQISNAFGVIRETIVGIRLGKRWKHIQRPPELTNTRKKLTKELVVEIIKLIRNGIDDDDIIAKQFNTTPRQIQRIRTGEIWKSVPR